MHRKLNRALTLLVFALVAVVAACSSSSDNRVTAQPGSTSTPAKPLPQSVRVGYFPNVTHAQPLVGIKEGIFQQELGGVTIEPKIFNAGPAEIEALFAGAIDIGYVGPSPAVNGYVQSRGDALRIVAGAASGGAALIVRADETIATAKDLAGKKIASPQLGNTQDIALRQYLVDNGLKAKENGGSVEVLPVANPDILSLFQRKQIDAAWVPEPWATRLVSEAGGRLFVDERTLWPNGKFATTVVVARRQFLQDQPEVVRRWLRGHLKTTQFIADHSDRVKADVAAEILRLTQVPISDALVMGAFADTDFVVDPIANSVQVAAQRAYALGFLNGKPDLTNIFDLTLLNGVLAELKLPQVK